MQQRYSALHETGDQASQVDLKHEASKLSRVYRVFQPPNLEQLYGDVKSSLSLAEPPYLAHT